MKFWVAACLFAVGVAPPVVADDTVASLDELLESFGWDFATAEIQSQKLGEGLYVLFGIGGNIGVSIGENGTLIVDDQFPELMP